MRRRALKAEHLGWSGSVVLRRLVQRDDGMSLALVLTDVGRGLWMSAALETRGTSLHEVLHGHAHHVISDDTDLTTAKLEADSYAASWLNRSEWGPACECKEIEEA